jgi:predicted permease
MAFRRLRRLGALLRPARIEQDLSDELAFHVDRETEKLVASGLDPKWARTQAIARFGSVALAAERCRDVRRLSTLSDLASDARFAWRQFTRRPGATAAIVVVLALGLGFSTAVFVLLWSLESGPPAGVARDESVVRIRGIDGSRGPGRMIGREFSYPEVQQYAAETSVFQAVAAWTSADVVLDVGTTQRDLQSGAATFVTGGYFQLLGVRPVLGAGLPAGTDDAGPPEMAAVISDALWRRFYARSRQVIGRRLAVNGVAVTIVGVAPPRFVGARPGGSAARVWLPLNARAVVLGGAITARLDEPIFGAIARLASGVGHDRASAAAGTIASRFDAVRDAPSSRARSADVVPVFASNYFPPSGERPAVAGRILGLSIPVLVLLITGTSVSALLAGLSLSRRREMAVRMALGAGRWRIVRQLLTETTILALAAGALAVAVLWLLLRTFEASFLEAPLTITWHAGLFAGALALFASVIFGLSPAIHATRTAAGDVLKATDTNAARTRLQASLVVAQIAFTQPALLAMGSALLQLREELGRQSVASVADEIVEVRFNTNPRYGALDDRREAVIARVQEHLQALPGVAGVVAQDIHRDSVDVFPHPDDRLEGGPEPTAVNAAVQSAPDGFFEVSGLPIDAGRAFAAGDASSRHVIVDASLAERVWPAGRAVGRRLIAEDAGGPRNTGAFTVIGVVPRQTVPIMFVQGRGPTTSHLLVRTRGPANPLIPSIRAAALDVGPDVPIISARTQAAIESDGRRATTRSIAAAGGVGLVALLLSAIGLYAVVAVAVEERRREIGIRAALGSAPRRTMALFVRRGVSLCLAGVGIGTAASLAVVRILAAADGHEPPSGMLGVSAAVTTFVIAIALLAAWIPARRAASLDPLSILRAD